MAPRDPKEGGTWIGLNEEGLFTALTNQPAEDPEEGGPSRGQIVATLLEEAGSMDDTRNILSDFTLNEYDPFSLVVVSPSGILTKQVMDDGSAKGDTHISGNFILSSEKGFEIFDKSDWDRFPWRQHSGLDDPDKLRGRLQRFCKQRDSFRHRDEVCRKGEDFGTLSSTIVILDRSRPEMFFDFAQGPPCESPYKAVSVSDNFKRSVFERWSD